MILCLDGSSLTYAQLADLAYGRAQAAFAPAAIERMEKARRIAEAATERKQQTYGLTTGVTILPQTTVHGTSSLGLPAQAQVQSQANFFVGARFGLVATPGLDRRPFGILRDFVP